MVGTRCQAARCGDGIVAGVEDCDDGNTRNGDGCSSTCRFEEGFRCPTPGQDCIPTRCGDGVREGTEQCDDGNNEIGDGCTPYCKLEPRCTNGTCNAQCGDGVRLPNEACDDGNTRNGDGCSSTCTIETGFTCEDDTTEPSSVRFPIIYRDFIRHDRPGGHPDFEAFLGFDVTTGIVQNTLGPDNKPVYAASGTPATTSGATNFNKWYRTDPLNRTVVDQLTLTRIAAGQYRFTNRNFFPINGRGWQSDNTEPTEWWTSNNYFFTTEIRYWFEYKGGEVLTFIGDDDLWVFINRRLAVDLGGVHDERTGSVTLNAATATNLGLTVGGIYEVAVFHAERKHVDSRYQLTLQNFRVERSVCRSHCGDGIVAADEVCDDGINDGRYGGCMPGCQARGPRCGDGTRQQPQEFCDDGLQNLGGYNQCTPTCQRGPHCGDGVVQPQHEVCDDGINDGRYGGCMAGCQARAPRCGDGVVQASAGETCDDGPNNTGAYGGCGPNCRLAPRCGDGIVQKSAGETCDDGINDGRYGGCTSTCRMGPRCGDNIVQASAGETCDDGRNDGSYGGCSSDCQRGPFCGDALVQPSYEGCDDGVNDGRYGGCTSMCTRAPFCGDSIVQTSFGESCDDGRNDGRYGGCTPTCARAPHCGDGVRQPSYEQCDLGAANNTGAYGGCTSQCRLAPRCGDGVVQASEGETCDDGRNNGSYGGCTPTCQYAPRCGDGILDRPQEQCDDGNTVSNDGCSATCESEVI